MAKTKTPVSKAKKTNISHLRIALTKKNYAIIGIGLLIIIIGYVLMAENSVDGFLPTVLAPILLVIGYCVAIPFGILYKDKSVVIEETVNTDGTVKKVEATTSNIKTA